MGVELKRPTPAQLAGNAAAPDAVNRSGTIAPRMYNQNVRSYSRPVQGPSNNRNNRRNQNTRKSSTRRNTPRSNSRNRPSSTNTNNNQVLRSNSGLSVPRHWNWYGQDFYGYLKDGEAWYQYTDTNGKVHNQRYTEGTAREFNLPTQVTQVNSRGVSKNTSRNNGRNYNQNNNVNNNRNRGTTNNQPTQLGQNNPQQNNQPESDLNEFNNIAEREQQRMSGFYEKMIQRGLIDPSNYNGKFEVTQEQNQEPVVTRMYNYNKTDNYDQWESEMWKDPFVHNKNQDDVNPNSRQESWMDSYLESNGFNTRIARMPNNPIHYDPTQVNPQFIADLLKLRYDLYNSGIFDSRNADWFTRDHLKQYLQYQQEKGNFIPDNDLFKNFSNDEIIDILNYVAQNENQNNNSKSILYAKNGTNITQYFKNGKKIHIKESQKGSFTRYCGGNVTSECIARGKASPDPRIRKKATFAANARKWKHQYGGSLNYGQNDIYDEDDDRIDYRNIAVDKEIFNPYGRFAFGLDDEYEPDKWYVGNKGGGDQVWNNHVNIVKTVYQQLQTAIRNTYNNYSDAQVNQLADWMTRHYIGENGWTPMNKVKNFGGFSGARTIAGWVTGMKEWYPKSMSATNFRGYIEGLKSNKNGQRYNSVQPGNSYYNNLFRDFGPGTRVDKILKQINGTK